MRSQLFLVVLIGICCLASSASPPTGDVESWLLLIKNSEVQDTCRKIVSELPNKSWPKIPWIREQDLPDKQAAADAGKEIADLTRKALAEFDRVHGNADVHEMTETVGVYSSLSRAFSNAGGFVNLVLSDSAARVALLRLSHFLLNNPEHVDLVASCLDQVAVPELTTSMLEQVYEELTGDRIELINLSDEEVKGKFLSGSIESTDRHRPLFAQALIPSLIAEGSRKPFLARILETQWLKRIALAATIEYLRKGGTVSDLPDLDEKGLDRFFGIEDRRKYRFDPLGKTTLFAGDLKCLLEFKASWREPVFFKVAVDDEETFMKSLREKIGSPPPPRPRVRPGRHH